MCLKIVLKNTFHRTIYTKIFEKFIFQFPDPVLKNIYTCVIPACNHIEQPTKQDIFDAPKYRRTDEKDWRKNHHPCEIRWDHVQIICDNPQNSNNIVKPSERDKPP